MTSPIAHHVATAAHPEDVERILGRCRHDPDTGCLEWAGALSAGQWPRVYVTNTTTGERHTTPGRKGVWMAMTGKPVPNGWRVYGTCTNVKCLEPTHITCGPSANWGKQLRATGHFKNRPARIAANRATGQQRRKVLDAHIPLVREAATLAEAAQAIGVHVSTISRYRRSLKTVHALTSNPFAGLMK